MSSSDVLIFKASYEAILRKNPDSKDVAGQLNSACPCADPFGNTRTLPQKVSQQWL